MIGDRLTALELAVEAGRGALGAQTVERAEGVLARAGERLRLSDRHTVVAIAGATGAGKSSLVNALVGAPVSQVDVLRPTTSHALAVLGSTPADGIDVPHGDQGAGALLDWLGVRSRVTPPGFGPDGLVVLDLPDHDSIRTEHRMEAERLVALVDLMVWVLDPQKYADAAVHERYLRNLVPHRDVILVVLNQVDRLPHGEQDAAVADVRRLLAEDGLAQVPVLATSARDGQGVEELRDALVDAAVRRQARVERVTADIAAVAGQIVVECGDAPRPPAPSRVELVDALARAAGVPTVVDAVAGSVRLSARLATGWPPLRWLSRLRADPLRTLHLAGSGSSDRHATSADADSALGAVRTSLPTPGVAQLARAAGAIRDWREAATAGLPTSWSLLARASEPGDELADQLDDAVARTQTTRVRRPLWWAAVNALQWVLVTVAAVGLGWLALLWGLDSFVLVRPDPPTWGGVPVPTVLVVAGVLTGQLVAGLSRMIAEVGAKRQSRRATVALRSAVEQVADRSVVEPVIAVVDRWQQCCDRAREAGARADETARGGRRGKR